MKTKINYINFNIWILPVVMLILAAVAFPFLPAEIARQWDSAGNVTSTASKWTVFLPALICAFVLLKGNIVPFIDPKKSAYSGIQKEYSFIHLIIALVLFFTEIYLILFSLGMHIPLGIGWFSIIIGVVFVLIGNILPKIPPTYLTGIKSVWAYGNDEIWTKTQRFAGKLWVVFGLFMMLAIFFPQALSHWLYPVSIIMITAAPRLYSLLLHYKMVK